MAELADAHDSKSCGKPCGFESHFGHHKIKKYRQSLCFYFSDFKEWGSKRRGQVVGRIRPTHNVDKKCPVDIFYDAACRVPLWGFRNTVKMPKTLKKK